MVAASDSDKGVTIFNSSPEAEIASHEDGAEILEGVVISFYGSVSEIMWRSS